MVLSGGCTPTAALTRAGVTELRPGVYVLMDAGQLALGAATPDQVALTVRATVVSDAVPGQVVLDAGAKLLGMDRPAFVRRPRSAGGLPGGPDHPDLGSATASSRSRTAPPGRGSANT